MLRIKPLLALCLYRNVSPLEAQYVRLRSRRSPGPRCGILFLVLALCLSLGASTLAQADPPGLTVIARMTPDAYRQLTAAQVTTAIDYGSFVWVEMTPQQAAALRQAGVSYEGQPRAAEIGLLDYRFDTRWGEPAIPANLRADAAGGKEGFYLVQFAGPARGEWLAGLEGAGLRVLQYVPRHAYLVWGTPKQVQSAEGAAQVRWVGAFHPAYKINPALRAFKDGSIENVAVTFYDDGAMERTLQALERLGGKPVQHFPAQPDAAFYTAILALDAGRLEGVAHLPTVWAVDYASPVPGFDDELADQIAAGNYPGGVPIAGYYDWLDAKGVDGSGIAWADVDTGLNGSHPDITGRVIAFVSYPGAGVADVDLDGHGSHTAGAIFGDGRDGTGITDPSGFYWGTGMAPQATLVVQNALMGTNWPPLGGWQVLSRDSVVNGALGSSNSWYTGANGSQGYSSAARSHDILVRDANWDTPGVAEPIVMVFSAGNAGDDCGSPPCYTSITEPKEAKNLLVVGAAANYPRSGSSVQDVVYFSSRGPAQDGRILPNVLTPGRQTVSFNGSGYNCGTPVSGSGSAYYNYCSGTSMACPQVAGASALVADWWAQESWGAPSPAMVKALLINGAVDMFGGDDGWGSPNTHLPNHDQGWGQVNLDNVIRNGETMIYRDQDHIFTDSGQAWTMSGGVADPTRPFKVTLAWSDAPGAIGANPALVNDLDLEVTVGSTTYKGNVFAGGWSASGGTADGLNNVENVYVQNPGLASVQIRVVAHNVAGDGVPYNGDATDQDFALVVYNAIQEPDFTLSASPQSQTVCGPQTLTYSVPVGSVLGYSETVTLSLGGAPANTPWDFQPLALTPPLTSTLSVTATGATPAGTHPLVITGTAEMVRTHTAEIDFTIHHAAPPAPTLLSPADGAPGVSTRPHFTWSSVFEALSHRLQVSTDTLFTSPLIDVSGLSTHTYAAETTLAGNTCYFWRVDGTNSCGEGVWSNVSSFETERFQQVFGDDMESGTAQWSHAAGQGTDAWALTTATAHSPSHAWFSPDVGVITDDYLWNTTPFPVADGATLSFWHRYNLETGYDGGVVEISTDGGTIWHDLEPYITQNPYDGTISTGYDSPIGGRQAWTGNSGTWEQVEVDLSAYAGWDAQVRWRLACDRSVSGEGWYVDDVAVVAPLPPNDFDYGSCLSIETPSHFTATVSGAYTYNWGFGGPGSGVGLDTPTPAFTYTVPGDYFVQLTLENLCAVEAISHEVSVCGQWVHGADFVVSANPRSSKAVTFTASVAGAEPIDYLWDFGDGHTGGGVMASHTYQAGGDYTVALSVSNCGGCGHDQVERLVSVCDSVHGVDFDVPPDPALVNQVVAFTASAEGDLPLDAAWDFGDGHTGSGLTASHAYTAAGDYFVTLTVTNCGDARVEVSRPIHVEAHMGYLPLVFKYP